MLPNNIDMLYVAIEERRSELMHQAQRASALPGMPGPLRRIVGRFLIWSGHHLSGATQPQAAGANSQIPVTPFPARAAFNDLDIAA